MPLIAHLAMQLVALRWTSALSTAGRCVAPNSSTRVSAVVSSGDSLAPTLHPEPAIEGTIVGRSLHLTNRNRATLQHADELKDVSNCVSR